MSAVASLMFAISAPIVAQGVKPQKGAAAILVRTAEAPEAAYQAIARVLTTRGYGFQSSDATLLAVTTTFKDAKGAGPVQVTAIVTKDSLGTWVQLTGVWKWTGAEYLVKGAGETPNPIEYSGSGGSPKRGAWNELYAIAQAYPGGGIQFRSP